MPTFADHVADALLADSIALGARWRAQARAVAPRVAGRLTPVQGAGTIPSADSDVLAAAAAEGSPAIVHALACALRNAPRCQDGVLRAGWDYGATTHHGGASLHHIVKELDLLASMALYIAERAAEGREGEGVGAAEGVRVSRRLHRAFTTLRLAASKGYTHAAGEELRDRYRLLRHDLRNPIGTIRSAVSLMEDESLPSEVRFSARYRAMVVRNATSLDAMIGAGLSDAATDISSLILQEVSLRDVALAVRRDMREEAESAACTIDVAPSLGAPALPTVFTDSAAFELALRSVVSIALARARRGTALVISLRGRRRGMAVVAVTFDDAAPAPAHGDDERASGDSLSFADTLAQRAGGRVWREGAGTVLLEIPIADAEREAEPPAAPSEGTAPVVRPSHAGDDLAGSSQRDHR